MFADSPSRATSERQAPSYSVMLVWLVWELPGVVAEGLLSWWLEPDWGYVGKRRRARRVAVSGR